MKKYYILLLSFFCNCHVYSSSNHEQLRFQLLHQQHEELKKEVNNLFNGINNNLQIISINMSYLSKNNNELYNNCLKNQSDKFLHIFSDLINLKYSINNQIFNSFEADSLSMMTFFINQHSDMVKSNNAQGSSLFFINNLDLFFTRINEVIKEIKQDQYIYKFLTEQNKNNLESLRSINSSIMDLSNEVNNIFSSLNIEYNTNPSIDIIQDPLPQSSDSTGFHMNFNQSTFFIFLLIIGGAGGIYMLRNTKDPSQEQLTEDNGSMSKTRYNQVPQHQFNIQESFYKKRY